MVGWAMTAMTRKANRTTGRQTTRARQVKGNVFRPELADWPRSWMGVPDDLLRGQRIVACFQPFLEHLVQSNPSRKTLRRHVNNLWLLGGEIIRDLNQTPSLGNVPIERLVFDLVQDGGPLLHHSDSEEESRSFESTCRRFRRFLEQLPR
jgi:hypothetical protein